MDPAGEVEGRAGWAGWALGAGAVAVAHVAAELSGLRGGAGGELWAGSPTPDGQPVGEQRPGGLLL